MCFEISTGRIYISRDVIFDETLFPFSTLHPNAGALLRAEIALLLDYATLLDHGGELTDHDHVQKSKENCVSNAFCADSCRHFMCTTYKIGTASSADSADNAQSQTDPRQTAALGRARSHTDSLLQRTLVADSTADQADPTSPGASRQRGTRQLLPTRESIVAARRMWSRPNLPWIRSLISLDLLRATLQQQDLLRLLHLFVDTQGLNHVLSRKNNIVMVQ